MLGTLLTDTITRLRAPLISTGYGNSGRDWNNPTSQVYACYVSFASSTEDVVNLDQTQTRAKVTLGPEADIDPTDRMLYRGNTYEVEGDVMPSLRRGVLHHQRVVLRRVELAAG